MTSSPVTALPVPAQKQDKPRPHTCATCLRAFARLEHLKRHERSHTKEKPFECPICERRFARRDLLLRHQQKLHTGLATTRQRQPRKNSITVATLGRPRKEPPTRPRANTFSGPSPVSKLSPNGLDSTASTNSWLESTFGKGVACDNNGSAWYIANANFSDSATANVNVNVNADASSPKATLFGSLYINPDLLPFTLPDNESLGLTTDEDALEFDEDYWLGNLSIASPTTATSTARVDGNLVDPLALPHSTRPEDYASPISYDTPASTTSTVSSFADNVKTEPGINMDFTFPPANSSNSGDNIMSQPHVLSQVDAAQRRRSHFDDTISPSLLMDQQHMHHLYSEMSIDPLSTFHAQPSPTPSLTSTTSRSSNTSSANTSIATSSPPIEHGALPVVKRHSSVPTTSSSFALPSSKAAAGSTIAPEMLFAARSQPPSLLLNTLSARNAFAPTINDTSAGDFTSELFNGDLPVFTTMSQLHLKDSPSQVRNSLF
ncbi:uncharacterized protein V1513DRAFT_450447 [Lipomyces chichibuensis]|uniref:uncharacterized protein n=1 Tax=Lipomyces chichibuensis TaxID=1546026 RepID=UPI0033440C3E